MAHSSQSHHVHSHFDSQLPIQAGPNMRTNPTVPIIDPALDVVPKVLSNYSPMGGNAFQDSGDDGMEGSTRDDGSQSDGNEEAVHTYHHSVTHQGKFKVLSSS